MMQKPVLAAAVVSLIALLGWLVLAFAQESTDKKATDSGAKKGQNAAPEAARDFDDVYPDVLSPAEVLVKLPDGRKRKIGIQRQNPASVAKVRGRYFHWPLFQFVEPPRAHPGCPAFVWDVDPDSATDGSVAVYFKVVTSSPALRKQCRDAVLRDDREAALQGGAAEDDVHVMRWPLKHAVIACKNTSTGEVIAVGQTDNLRSEGDDFTFVMTFAPDELQKFKRFAELKRLVFVFSYSFKGATTHTGSVDLKGVKNARLLASQKLTSQQSEGQVPIFQGEANAAMRHVKVSVEKTMRATHKDLIPLLDTPNLFHKLFADDGQINFKDLKEGDEKTAAMLAAYLKPHLEQVRESFGGEKSEITIHEDKVGEGSKSSWNLGGSASATVPIKTIPVSLSLGGGLGRESTKTKEVLDRVEKVTGSKWGYDKATERFRPHSIQKFKWQEGADAVQIDEKTTVFLSVGPENRYLEETPVPVSFTTRSVEEAEEPRVVVRRHRLVEHQRLGGKNALHVALSPDGRRALSCGIGAARVWDVESGRELHHLQFKGEGARSVAFSPDGKRFLVGLSDKSVRMYDADSFQEVGRFQGHAEGVMSAVYSPDGRRVLSGGMDGTARLWDVATGRELRCFKGHVDMVRRVAFSPDGRRAVSGGDATVRIWEVDTGDELHCLRGHQYVVEHVAFSPTGKHVLSCSGGTWSPTYMKEPGGRDHTVWLWDAETGRLVRRLEGHTDFVTSAAFLPDGARVLSRSQDETLRLWEVATGKEVARAPWPNRSNRGGLSLSADGTKVLVGGLGNDGMRLFHLSR